MTRTRLEWACWMAEKGIRVFIARAGEKNPLKGRSWYTFSSTDPNEIAEMFEEEPDCNYGLWLGDNYCVIDLDIKPDVDGIQVFKDLCDEHGVFYEELRDSTLTADTPSAGVHLYFKSPFGVSNANDFPAGIDTRGAQGYVIGPGCRIVEYDEETDSSKEVGIYQLADPTKDIADLPEWLYDYVRTPGARDPKVEELVPGIDWDQDENIQHAMTWLQNRDPASEGAHGDDWTVQTAYFMRDFGLSEAEALRVMQESGWNARCEPPWDGPELERKVRNAYSYPQNRPGIKSPAYRSHMINMVAGAGLWQDMLTQESIAELFHPSHHLRLVVDNDEAEVPDAVADNGIDPVTGEPADTFPWYDILTFADRGTKREYVIDEWLLSHGVTHMLAKRGTGKSTVALDMAFHVACDLDWANQSTAKGWKVIYICGEDDVGMEVNVNAWIKEHPDVEIDPTRFLVAADIIKLTDDMRLDLRIQEMIKWAAGERCVVILDTWQRATMGWSKNDMEAMESAISRAERIAHYLRGPLLSLVHPPKDGRMTVKGAGEQEDTSTGILILTGSTAGLKLEVERIKGAGKDNYVNIEFTHVQLDAKDQFGKPMKGIVANTIGGTVNPSTLQGQSNEERERVAWAQAIYGVSKIHMNAGLSHVVDQGSEVSMVISKVKDILGQICKTAHELKEGTGDDEMRLPPELAFCKAHLSDLEPFTSGESYGHWTPDRIKSRLEKFFQKPGKDGGKVPPVMAPGGGWTMKFEPKKKDGTHRVFQFEMRGNNT